MPSVRLPDDVFERGNQLKGSDSWGVFLTRIFNAIDQGGQVPTKPSGPDPSKTLKCHTQDPDTGIIYYEYTDGTFQSTKTGEWVELIKRYNPWAKPIVSPSSNQDDPGCAVQQSSPI